MEFLLAQAGGTSNPTFRLVRSWHQQPQRCPALQDTLRAARQGLAERDFLVAAHEHSEAALAGAAAGLRAELAATAAELAAVFAKVDAQAGAAAANSIVVRDLRLDAATRLKVLLHVPSCCFFLTARQPEVGLKDVLRMAESRR